MPLRKGVEHELFALPTTRTMMRICLNVLKMQRGSTFLGTFCKGEIELRCRFLTALLKRWADYLPATSVCRRFQQRVEANWCQFKAGFHVEFVAHF